ncbi:MAG: hypothetical protein ACTSVF_01275 [Candidatus Asgardarchaeia archaeon]
MVDVETQHVGRVGYSYRLRFQLGNNDLAIEPYAIDEFTITTDINQFLPSLRVSFTDSQGLLTHVIPFDSRTNKVTITVGRGIDVHKQRNEYTFDIYRRFPNSRSRYDIEGLLSVENLFSPQYIRSFNGTIKETLTSIGNELGVDKVEIDPSLDYRKSLIQPSWTNAQFLNYLKRNLVGKWNEGCFYAFIKNVPDKGSTQSKVSKILVFSHLKTLFAASPKYNFVVGGESREVDEEGRKYTYFPVYEHQIYDNYKVIGLAGSRSKQYSYFDYENSTFNMESIGIQEYPSLTDYFLVDQNDADVSLYPGTGQSNQFTSNFRGRAMNEYFKDLTNLTKMWITTWGLEDLCPGDIVKVKFGLPPLIKYTMSLVYQGFWMVERVIHIFGPSYMMKVLLTRNGIDYLRPEGGEDTTLIAAS